MEIREMNMEQIEARKLEINAMLDSEDADLEALNKEVDELENRKSQILLEAENRNAEINAVIEGKGVEKEGFIEARKEQKMDSKEIRNSVEYINAYANFIKTGKDEECRTLLTENVSGTVPVPEYLEQQIRHAWDEDEILARVKKTFFKGNVKVGVELAGTAAAVHTEGGDAPSEETLTLYIANLVPETIKKWIKISDEVMDMGGQAFLDYLYAEIEQKIVKKAADLVVADIVALATSGTSAPIRGNVAKSGITDILKAFALLSDEAKNPVCIMSKASYAYYKGLAIAANYAVDPFMGMDVLFNDTLADASASGSSVAVIVGDLDGIQCNFPVGYEPQFKYDDLSLAESDLVKIVGRLPMAHEVVATNFFATVTQAS